MIYRKIDNGGDYCFGRSSQDFVQGAQAVAQVIRTRLLLLKSEWWENQDEGLPLFQSILGQAGTPDNLKAIDLIIRDRISTAQDVTGIEDFKSSYANRKYSVLVVVNTKYGTAEVEVSL